MTNVVPLGYGQFSGKELPHGSDNVWGLAIFGTGVAHFYQIRHGAYVSKCKRSIVQLTIPNGQCGLLGVGSFKRCRKCAKPKRGVGSY